jgi:hypothetical protein
LPEVLDREVAPNAGLRLEIFMDGNSFIAQLREIRANLIDVLHSDHQLDIKFSGPVESSDGKTPAPTCETVRGILCEISGLSSVLMKNAGRRHELLGDFSANAQAANPVAAGQSRWS